MAEELLVERRGSVLWLTLNRPERHNAINGAMTAALVEALGEASTDIGVRAIVLTGAGERTFCSGADLKDQSSMFASAGGTNPIGNVLRAVQACSKLVVARLNGSALAGGLGLVAACDLAYAAHHAKFGLPEVRVGVFPMMIATRLTRQIPERRFREMAYLGETIGTEEAERHGLINRAVPAAELDALIQSVLDKLMLGAPGAISAGKQALSEMQDMPQTERLAYAERMIATLGESTEAREGRTAFAEKRRPGWVLSADDV
ncbi:enoyl-CoA hydratase/isomerase family protein [Rhizobium sp. TH2]|uniref:enoyl-CoA hydratase-related protein n=1 Tax=Rhizobium sp. TH2 TaxID=2775403 RepID=UPI0021570419|nr:enoyl-CoA hydratase-related protein [Rhizobium sp. TH2]UVC09906.1 enoyl-CoA hydratase/isomerase family protein [Rhizobium sp. TH2]